jgi:hypothetical protein
MNPLRIFSSLIFRISCALLLVSCILFLTRCNKDDEPDNDCSDEQYFGYEVWAGDSALFLNSNLHEFYYEIQNYYTFIDSASTTKSFNTGSFKYYVIVTKWYACIDAIQFNDSSYYNLGSYTLITGLAEHPPGGSFAMQNARFLGAPDSIGGNLGYKWMCDNEGHTYMGYITDNATILSRGGGLTVYVTETCD